MIKFALRAIVLAAVLLPYSAGAEVVVYWTESSGAGIGRAVASIAAPETLIVELDSASGIAVDVDKHRVYWSDAAAGCIYYASLSGAPVELFISGLDSPQGIALDLTTAHIYWAEQDKIRGADLVNADVFTVVTDLDRPSGLAVDTANGYLYWCEQKGGRIQRATTLGGGLEDVVTGLQKPKSIAYAAPFLYWCDSGSGEIQSAAVDGSALDTLISGIEQPSGLDADEGNNALFWTDAAGVGLATLGGASVASFATVANSLGAIAIADMPDTTPLGREQEVWVDFENGAVQTGTYLLPFYTIPNAFNKVAQSGVVKVVSGNSDDTGVLNFNCRIEAYNGPVRLGRP